MIDIVYASEQSNEINEINSFVFALKHTHTMTGLARIRMALHDIHSERSIGK